MNFQCHEILNKMTKVIDTSDLDSHSIVLRFISLGIFRLNKVVDPNTDHQYITELIGEVIRAYERKYKRPFFNRSTPVILPSWIGRLNGAAVSYVKKADPIAFDHEVRKRQCLNVKEEVNHD